MNDGKTHKYAFADQVEQKVIPKLRGIDLNENSSRICLDEIYNLVAELGDGELEKLSQKVKMINPPERLFGEVLLAIRSSVGKSFILIKDGNE